jgi:hypothetical protein
MAESYNGSPGVGLSREIRIRTWTRVSSYICRQDEGTTHGDEQVWHLPFILFPGFAILDPAPLDVSDSAMDNHGGEEDRIKPWEGRPESCKQTPG